LHEVIGEVKFQEIDVAQKSAGNTVNVGQNNANRAKTPAAGGRNSPQ
jgi:hypothetical protein